MSAKLDPVKEAQIDELLTAGDLTAPEIAARVGVGHSVIYAIKTGQRSRDLSRRMAEQSEDQQPGGRLYRCKACGGLIVTESCFACGADRIPHRSRFRDSSDKRVEHEQADGGDYTSRIVASDDDELAPRLAGDDLRRYWEVRQAQCNAELAPQLTEDCLRRRRARDNDRDRDDED